MLTFRNDETYTAIAAEVRPLLEAHWREVALDQEHVPLDIDQAKYETIEAQGGFVVVTARDELGYLVGYIAAIVSTHLHYKATMFGSLDVFWLHPDYRRGSAGIRLFREMENELKRRGVVKMIGQTKVHKNLDISAIYERLGWTKTEILFTKVVS